MKKIILIILFLTGIVSNKALCQKKPVPDSTANQLIRKNEIGTNIAPALIGFMGGFYDNARYTLTYKRLNGKKEAFRFGVNYTFPSSPDAFNGTSYSVVSKTDSSEIRQYSFSHKNDEFGLNLGYEFISEEKKWKIFYGLDVILGYYTTDSNIDNITYKQSSSYSYYGISYDAIEWQTITRSNSTVFYIGGSPFLGLKYPLYKHFLVSAQTGLDLIYNMVKNEKVDEYGNHSKIDFNTKSLNGNSLINNVSLIFSF